MAQVLLVRPGLADYYRGVPAGLAVTHSPPLNLAMLGACLERAGHRATAWDLEVAPRADLLAELRALAPDLVGITFRTPQLRQARTLAALVRNAVPRALLVAGGPHASALPEATLRDGCFDLVVRGEGERPIAALADGRRWAEIPGVCWEGGAAPPQRREVALDDLPLPAWRLFDLRAYGSPSLVTRGTPVADLESSRGCASGCIYCSKAVFGRRFVAFSPEHFLAAVDHAEACGFQSFNLVDDGFATDLERASAICELLARRPRPMPWTCTNGIRVTGVDEAFFRLARRAGCRLLAFGLESGSDALLHAVGKGATVAEGRAAIEAAHRAGLATLGFFMLGLPGETRASLRETEDFACSLPLDWAKFALTMPLPATALWKAWEPRLARPYDEDFSAYRAPEGWFQHPDLPWDVLLRARRRALLRFYGNPARAARLAWRGISAVVRP